MCVIHVAQGIVQHVVLCEVRACGVFQVCSERVFTWSVMVVVFCVFVSNVCHEDLVTYHLCVWG